MVLVIRKHFWGLEREGFLLLGKRKILALLKNITKFSG